MSRCRRPGVPSRVDALTLALLGACLATVLLAGCGRGASSPTPSARDGGPLAFAVTISDNKFTPSTLTVPPGTTVVWEWTGKNQHSVVGTFDSTAVDSGTHQGSGTFSFTFTTAGTYNYHCGVHGPAMSGKIVVR